MLQSLTIENFKCFEHLELSDLGQFNLITGKNNVGKSSLLEALLFANASTDADSLNAVCELRNHSNPTSMWKRSNEKWWLATFPLW